MVVVLSGSMEPGFFRGDILFLNMGKSSIRTGEIVVFNLDGRDIPIVHRVIKVGDVSRHDVFVRIPFGNQMVAVALLKICCLRLLLSCPTLLA